MEYVQLDGRTYRAIPVYLRGEPAGRRLSETLRSRLRRVFLDPHPERDESHAATRYHCEDECPRVTLLEDRLAVATRRMAELDESARLLGEELKKYAGKVAS